MYTVKIHWTRSEAVPYDPSAPMEEGWSQFRFEHEPNGPAYCLKQRQVDEATLFIPARCVSVMAHVDSMEDIEKLRNEWGYQLQDYASYLRWEFIEPGGTTLAAAPAIGGMVIQPSRLLCLDQASGDPLWYIASRAWLLGADGNTIERIVP